MNIQGANDLGENQYLLKTPQAAQKNAQNDLIDRDQKNYVKSISVGKFGANVIEEKKKPSASHR